MHVESESDWSFDVHKHLYLNVSDKCGKVSQRLPRGEEVKMLGILVG